MKPIRSPSRTCGLAILFVTLAWNSHANAPASPGQLQILPQLVPNPVRIIPRENQASISSWGTGFVIAPGYVLTAYHVVQQKNQIRVGPIGLTETGRPRWLPAELVKTDPGSDLALLSISESLPALKLHPGITVPIGLEALVIGFPQPRLQGASRKITAGIVNGYRNTLSSSPDEGMLQISAEVSNGNSGGPVMAPDGTVIGMVQKKIHTARVADRTQDVLINVGFALRSSQIVDFLRTAQVPFQTQAVNESIVLRPYQVFETHGPSVLAITGRHMPNDSPPKEQEQPREQP